MITQTKRIWLLQTAQPSLKGMQFFHKGMTRHSDERHEQIFPTRISRHDAYDCLAKVILAVEELEKYHGAHIMKYQQEDYC